MKLAYLAVGASVVAVALGATACRGANSAYGSSSEWRSGPPDLRKLTAVIRVTPPKALKDTFENIAARAKDEGVANFFHAWASGGSGSGFIMVRAVDGHDEEFVVTNRHVVSFAEDAQIGFDTGMSFANCEVVYTDPVYDLAVLSFPNDQRPVAYGLRPAAVAGADRQSVVATGFPELAGKPSFQTTEGKISNAMFELEESDGSKTEFIQHTAPIDPGSSGGPLTSESGELLGVNTMFLVNKHSAFFAVPAKDVVEAVRAAYEIKQKRSNAAWKREKLIETCRVLVGELASDHPRLGVIDDLISNKLVGDKGFESFRMVSNDKDFQQLFVADPIDGMRKALLLRLLFRVKAPKLGGGIAPNNDCTDIVENDAAHITTIDQVRSRIALDRGPLELAWTFEHGHWRIAGGDLGAGGDSDGGDD